MRPCDGEHQLVNALRDPQPCHHGGGHRVRQGPLSHHVTLVRPTQGHAARRSLGLCSLVGSSSILLLLKPLILLYFSGGAGPCSMVRWGCIEGVSSLTRAHRQLRHVSGDQHHHLVRPWGGVNGKFKLILKHSLCVTLRSGNGSRIVEV